MKPSDLKSGMKVEIRVKEGNDSREAYYVIRDMIVGLHIKNSTSYSGPYDSRIVADINSYTEEFNHKESPLLDIMKIYDEYDNLLFDRKNKTDWSKVELGTDVEYFKDNKWHSAKFVFYYKKSDIILMVAKEDMVYNHTSKTVRLKSKENKSKEVLGKYAKTDKCPTVSFPIGDEKVFFKVNDTQIINKLQELLKLEGGLEHRRF